jgi:dienelactone hydrolase
MVDVSQWTMPGGAGELMYGSTHLPQGDASGVVVIVPGFKGYKDYGMFPHMARVFASAGYVVHRVSLSHSGMGHGHGSFDEALFERDTWNRSIEDVQVLCAAIDTGRLAGDGRGTYLMGHSRGGAAVLTAAGRHAMDGGLGGMCGVIALSSPSRLLQMDDAEQQSLLEAGRMPSSSSRTGQTLHVGSAWLQEQLDDPAGHDLPALVSAIQVPVLLVHGADDSTVPAASAIVLAQGAPSHVQVHLVEHGDHVYNTPNPFDPDKEASPQLAEAEAAVLRFLEDSIRR